MRNSDPRVRIVFAYRHNSDVNSIFTLLATGFTDMTPEHYFCCAQCNLVTLGSRPPLQPHRHRGRMTTQSRSYHRPHPVWLQLVVFLDSLASRHGTHQCLSRRRCSENITVQGLLESGQGCILVVSRMTEIIQGFVPTQEAHKIFS